MLSHQLKAYANSDPTQLKFFMKVYPCPANDVKYIDVPPENCIEETLKYRTVLEFPVIYVCFKDHSSTEKYMKCIEISNPNDPNNPSSPN